MITSPLFKGSYRGLSGQSLNKDYPLFPKDLG